MGTPKVRYNKATGRWDVVSDKSSVDKAPARKTEVKEELNPFGGYSESLEKADGGTVRVLHAPTLKGRMKNNVDPDAGETHFVLSNQISEPSVKSEAVPTAESVAAEIENLDPELRKIFESYGGK